MDFAGMKRLELQALCAEHGLASRGSKADLAASLAGALPSSASAAAAEKVVHVVASKGCLKRLGDGPSSGSSVGVFKKVTFSFQVKEEAGDILISAKISRRGCQQKRVETNSAAEVVAGEVCANAEVIGSRTNAVNLSAGNRVEKRDDLADKEKVVGATIDRKQRTHENPKHIAASVLSGVSRRNTRKSISSTTANTSLRSQNASAEKEEVTGGAGHTKGKQKATEKLKVGDTGDTLPAAVVSGRGRRCMCASNSSVEVVTGDGAYVRETRSTKNMGNLCADSGVESQNISAEAEEDGEVLPKAVDSKWKQKTLHNAENIATNAHAGISLRSTRCSRLSADDVLLHPIVEKKRGRTAELVVDKKSADVQDFPVAASHIIIENKRSQSKEEYRKLAVQKSAKVAIFGRVTRSCSANAAAALPDVIENKSKMKTEIVHLDRVAPAVSNSDVPRNDAPITRSLRNRPPQNNNTMLEETQGDKKLEKKRKPRRPATGRCHRFSSFVEEGKQAAAPCKSPPLLENASGEELRSGHSEDVGKRPPIRRSTRNYVVAGRT